MKKIKLLLFFTFIVINCFSQDGTLDLSFNTPVHLSNPTYNGFWDKVYTTRLLNNGKLLVYGDLTEYMGQPVPNLVVLNPNGILDPSFNVGSGPNQISDQNNVSNNIAIQEDGKIIFGGVFNTFNGVASKIIVRLNTGGSIDNTFNVGTGFEGGVIYAVKIQEDGKIICGGNFTSYNGIPINSVARLNQNGTLDLSFNVGAGATDNNSPFFSVRDVYAIEVQPDGKILVGGNFKKFNTIDINSLVRLNSNGDIDNSFQIGNSTDSNGRVMKIIYNNLNDKILFSGTFNNFNGQQAKSILSLNQDGSIDTYFNPVDFTPIIQTSSLTINDFGLLSDGKIIVSGNFTSENYNNLLVMNPNGTEIPGFSFKFYDSSSALVNSIAIDNNDNIFIGGKFSNVNNTRNLKKNIAKIKITGETDTSFNPNLGTFLNNRALKLRNNKILLNASFYNERYCKTATINPDGSFFLQDLNNFNSNNHFHGFAKLSNVNNKVYVASAFVLRMYENGTFDNTFSSTSNLYPSPINFNIRVNTLIEQPDNKIVIAGFFRLNSQYYQNIARLNENGSVDQSFNVGNGFISLEDSVNDLAIQNDGKIVAVGKFNNYQDISNINRIIRLNTNGSFDNTFTIGSGFNAPPYKILLTPDNKFLICGIFTEYNGVSSPYIIRLNLDGSIDTTFISPFSTTTEYYNGSENILIQPNGKILISLYLEGAQKLYRLNNNGSIDYSFHELDFTSPSGCLDIVDRIRSINLIDNNILITGCFIYIDGIKRDRIAMLINSEASLDVSEENFNNDLIIYPNPTNDCFKINSENIEHFELYSINGLKLLSGLVNNDEICLSNLSPSIYLAKLYNTNGDTILKKIIKK